MFYRALNLAIRVLQFLTSYLLMILWCSLKPLTLVVTNLSNLLNDFCKASSQFINFSKSCMFFSLNTPEAIRREFEKSMRIGAVKDPRKCFAIPTLWGKAKKYALMYIHQGKDLDSIRRLLL